MRSDVSADIFVGKDADEAQVTLIFSMIMTNPSLLMSVFKLTGDQARAEDRKGECGVWMLSTRGWMVP